MNLKKIAKKVLFPPMAVLLVLLPVAAVFTIYAMIFCGEKSVVACVSYALAAYTLTIWCMRMPHLLRFLKKFKNENAYIARFLSDVRLRVKVSLYGALLLNTAFAVFQLGLGFYHGSFWYHSLAIYYLSLALMRFFLLRHVRAAQPGERMRAELVRYRACGIVLLVMNLALALIVFFMVYWGRTFLHHEITAITMATYTFVSFALAIVDVVKYRKYNSPVFSASKIIGFVAACVSMLTLETTLLTTFGQESTDALTRKLMLGLSGGVISALVIAVAIVMIVRSSKALKE